MNTNILIKFNKYIPLSIALILLMGCERELDDLQPATFPKNPEVFIDGFSAGLNYAAFGGSVPTAFDVDNEVTYNNSKASMRFDVPNAGDPEGAYAGGVFSTQVGRDLSSYNALTFWAKATQSATLDLVGLGNDLGSSKYQVTISGLSVSTSWKKFIIPIPDPSKLTAEKGMFFYSTGPVDGKGYTFWIDELKFENLGTIAHQKSLILDGIDKIESAVNGLKFQVGGLKLSINLPTGIDQTVNVAPAYFTFNSSNPGVASVDALGMVTVHSGGTTVITAVSGGKEAQGSLTVNSSGEFTHAPAPAAAQDNVISIFSNAYTNVPVDFYNGYWQPFQTTTSADFKVGEDNVLFYTNFNFVGIQFTTPTINATSMTHLHLDIWIPNEVAPSDKLLVKLVDMGPDGALDGNDPTLSYEIKGPLASQSWISVDISLSGLSSRSKLAQIIFERIGTSLSGFYLDNVYLYGNGGGTVTLPAEAAPTPPARNAADVISLYGDAYENLAGTDYPDWGQATVVSDVQIAGNNTLKFAGLNYQGIQLAASQNLTEMKYLHLDFWSANSSNLNVYLISSGAEKAYTLTVPTDGWTSVDIPLTSFSPVNLANIIQLKFDGNGDIFLDNIYFYTTGGGTATTPTVAAPTPPARVAADVVSIFSGAYTNIAGTDFNPGWGQSTVVSTIDIAGNSTLKYANFNYQGTALATPQDLTGMDYLHVDMWTADATVVQVTPINNNGSPAEKLVSLTPVTPGQWVSYDIPLTSFTSSGMAMNGVFQMKFDGQAGKTPSTIYLDNIYFYKSSGGGGGGDTGPTAAAPTPPARTAGNVVSIYSDAYTPIAIGNFDAGWCGGAAVTEVTVAGNKTLKKNAGIDCHGIDFSSNRQNLSSFTHIHFDFYSDDTDLTGDVFNVKLVDFAGGTGEASALEVNINTGTTPAIVAGQWVSVDIDITSLGGVVAGSLTRGNVAQIGITTANLKNVWYDNIYLYK